MGPFFQGNSLTEDRTTDANVLRGARDLTADMRPILKRGGRKRSPNKSPNGGVASPQTKRSKEFISPAGSGRRVTFSPFATKPKRRLQPKQLQNALDASDPAISALAFEAAVAREKQREARRKHDMGVLQTLFKAASKPRLSWKTLMDDHLALLREANLKISHWLHIFKKPFVRHGARSQCVVRSRTRHAPLLVFDSSDRQYTESVRAPLLPPTSFVSLDHAHRTIVAQSSSRSSSSPGSVDPRSLSQPVLHPVHHGSLSTLLRKEGITATEDDWREQAVVDNDLRGVTHRSTGLKIVPHHQELRVI